MFARISLVISGMGVGGAERVLSILANTWSEAGVDVQLVTIASEEEDFYTLNPAINRVGLDLIQPSPSPLSALLNNGRRVKAVRTALLDFAPDVVLSFAPPANVTTLLATRGTGIPVVVSERNDPTMRKQPLAWSTLRRLLYPRAAAVAVQTARVRLWASRHLPGAYCRVIPNPVRAIKHPDSIRKNGRYIVGMGRLVRQKGFDMLMAAFAATKADDWRLLLIGDGPGREELVQRSKALGIDDRVDFVGKVTDPETYLAGASIFALSSRYEGFPNALLEAMSLGIPSVSFDCPSGPGEIIVHGNNGLLVPAEDVAGLSSSLSELMHNPEYRARLGRAGADSVSERYSVDMVVSQWNRLLTGCLPPKPDRSERRAYGQKQ